MEWSSATVADGSTKVPRSWLLLHYYEALTILFRFENSLRVFVYAVMKNEFGMDWKTSSFSIGDGDPQSIKGIASKRISQAETFGYLGFDIRAPLMHLTSGELVELITAPAYWPKFRSYFRGDKNIIKNKLLEIGSIRNSLAHFRPIKPDDIEVVKQNSRHTLLEVEKCLNNLMNQNLRVPTNTTSEWYVAMTTLGTDQVRMTPYYSADESWISFRLAFSSPVLARNKYQTYQSHTVAKLKPASILTKYEKLREHVTFVTEDVSAFFDESGELQVRKFLDFVFRRDVLEREHAEIKEHFEAVLRKISEECELLTQDSLARGDLIESASCSSYWHVPEGKSKDQGRWDHGLGLLVQPFEAEHPDEYWGKSVWSIDIVGQIQRYPWMPADISESEFPF